MPARVAGMFFGRARGADSPYGDGADFEASNMLTSNLI